MRPHIAVNFANMISLSICKSSAIIQLINMGMLDMTIKVVRFRARFYRGSQFGSKLKFGCAESCWGVPSPNPARRRKLRIVRFHLMVKTRSLCAKTRLLLRKTTETIVFVEGSRAARSNASFSSFSLKFLQLCKNLKITNAYPH